MLACTYVTRTVAWENSQHFTTSPLVSLQNNVWETSAEIPYWWRIPKQTWVVLLIISWSKFLVSNEKIMIIKTQTNFLSFHYLSLPISVGQKVIALFPFLNKALKKNIRLALGSIMAPIFFRHHGIFKPHSFQWGRMKETRPATVKHCHPMTPLSELLMKSRFCLHKVKVFYINSYSYTIA